jgi:hypothetical protein
MRGRGRGRGRGLPGRGRGRDGGRAPQDGQLRGRGGRRGAPRGGRGLARPIPGRVTHPGVLQAQANPADSAFQAAVLEQLRSNGSELRYLREKVDTLERQVAP